jgi:spermidine synthase
MIPWELIDTANVPDDPGVLRLFRRDAEFSLRIDNIELMNSRVYGSEEALASLGMSRLKDPASARVLVGGLGMGYTLRAALDLLGPQGRVTVAELVPEVVRWNRELMAHLADYPLDDSRTTVFEGDVALLLKRRQPEYDLILLDVDNGPEGLVHQGNEWLYSPAGLAAASASLRPRGVLAIWSSETSNAFTATLKRAGFRVEERSVKAQGRRGSRYHIWLVNRP